MLQITFTANPQRLKGKIHGNRWACGLVRFKTRRAAAIYLADSGRRATAWMLELQELHRLAVHAGQAYVGTMDIIELSKWAQLKSDWDARYILIRRNAKDWTPSELWPRLSGLCRCCKAIAEMLAELGGLSERVQSKIIASRCAQIAAEVTEWAAGPPAAHQHAQA